MAFEMVDGEIWLAETKREPFCDGSTNHERASQTGARCRCKCVYFIQGNGRFLHRALQKRWRVQQMITRSYFRDNAAIGFVLPLRCNFARQQFVATQDRDGCLVARSFNREEGLHGCVVPYAVIPRLAKRAEGPH